MVGQEVHANRRLAEQHFPALANTLQRIPFFVTGPGCVSRPTHSVVSGFSLVVGQKINQRLCIPIITNRASVNRDVSRGFALAVGKPGPERRTTDRCGVIFQRTTPAQVVALPRKAAPVFRRPGPFSVRNAAPVSVRALVRRWHKKNARRTREHRAEGGTYTRHASAGSRYFGGMSVDAER